MSKRTMVLVAGGLLLGGALWVFVPAVQKYQRRAKTSEATMNIRAIFDSSVSYYTSDHCPDAKPKCPRQFPTTVALTPAAPHCRDGKPFTGPFDAADWDHPTWKALKFAPEGELYFRFAYVSAGRGPDAAFTVRAIGDLDCDGVFSTFERVAAVDDNGDCTGHGGGQGLFMANELE